jgi:hypothetical protein
VHRYFVVASAALTDGRLAVVADTDLPESRTTVTHAARGASQVLDSDVIGRRA